MSNSTDSLKKKVCVTVFLDELFEEVLDENWRDFKQVSEFTESEMKLAAKSLKGPPRIVLGNDEKVSPNADIERKEVQLRPRKHRRESKFSKNRHAPYKDRLVKAEYVPNFKTGDEYCEALVSPFSDSDLDLNALLEDEKWALGNSKSSCSEFSEGDLSEDSFLSIQAGSSSLMLCCPRSKKQTEQIFHVPHRSTMTKSIRSAGSNSEIEINNGQMGDDIYLEKTARNTGKDVLSWKKTQRQIQMVLASAKSKQLEKDTSKGDCGQFYDLRSILEACVKVESNTTMTNDGYFYTEEQLPVDYKDSNESAAPEIRDSNKCVSPYNEGKRKTPHSEVNGLCCKKNSWNECPDSDPSEVDSSKPTGLRSMKNESMLCYTLCLKCKRSIYEEPGMVEAATFDATQSSTYPTSRESSYESVKSKASQNANIILRTVTHLANPTILGPMLETEQQKQEDSRGGEKIATETCKCPPTIENEKSNFAEGDTFQKSSLHNQKSSLLDQKSSFHDEKVALDVEGSEKINASEEIHSEEIPSEEIPSEEIPSEEVPSVEIPSQLEERETVSNKILAEETDVAEESQDEEQPKSDDEFQELSLKEVDSGGIAEYLFKHQRCLEKNMTDAESEMVFAESENSYECDDFFETPPASPVLSTPRNNICVVEFEDKLSRSKILRRMKTVEILGDNSSNDMRTHISTEVFLMCENISSNDVCLEAWHSSASTLRSFSEMGQCYLKDSNDSAMYLIEIPLHFINTNKRKPCKSEQVSDSE